MPYFKFKTGTFFTGILNEINIGGSKFKFGTLGVKEGKNAPKRVVWGSCPQLLLGGTGT